MNILENIPLAPLTTFRVGGPARYFADCKTEADLHEALAFADQKRLPLFLLGGGSNLLVADAGWPGVVLKVSLPGIEFDADRGQMVFFAGAGENWDDFVAFTIANRCAGLECMSGIPGTVGGTPVQNVGAYGQEISETVRSVRALEIATGRTLDLNNSDCNFAYRSSRFNTSDRGRFIVMEVAYGLHLNGAPHLEYADLKKHFGSGAAKPTLRKVRDAVREIRNTKGMLLSYGEEESRSAGSFFKNPMVPESEAERVRLLADQRAPGAGMPSYPARDGQLKLSAAWLVEQAGFHKGLARGPVGISHKHSLAIVNLGGARAADIFGLQQEVRKAVFDCWGIQLEPEPVFVGFGGE